MGTVFAVPTAVVVLLSTAGCGIGVLDKAEVSVDGRSFRVEVARTGRQQQQGLSERSTVPAGSGMLFDFSGRRVQKVWMADTLVPLDAAWISDDAVVAIRTLKPCGRAEASDCPTWISPQPVDALLEVPAGALDGVPIGARVRISEQHG
ncbi:DUF192 domain-containing protein [Microlunatus soli]|uniref:DUF192 domain-containing protein n=1 Tax=Microlunatus soli TaxID=630515 RepID=A0A1H1UHP9_9ACTN|nr:DUF192 domain-containing protein [Microlunatus soli]SDS71880.1 hypothetical protein SAMN04489812_2789 [Microlunatus soli]